MASAEPIHSRWVTKEACGMFQVPDRYQRKLELAAAFWKAAMLPGRADAKAYERLLKKLGVESHMDLSILCSIVQDAIMEAKREAGPTEPLEAFLIWLKVEKLYR